MAEIKLKPCPFCGGEVRLFAGVHCSWIDCECGIKTQVFKTKEEAIETWNTREPMERILKHLENMKHKNCETENTKGYNMGVNMSIEIVKAGGVNE